MKRVLTLISALTLLISALTFLVPARASYVFDDIQSGALNSCTVEEIVGIEAAVVDALRDVFERNSYKNADGELVGTYILNTHTKKFHYPYCYSGLSIGPDRDFATCAPSELIARGYSPCGQCKPDK